VSEALTVVAGGVAVVGDSGVGDAMAIVDWTSRFALVAAVSPGFLSQ